LPTANPWQSRPGGKDGVPSAFRVVFRVNKMGFKMVIYNSPPEALTIESKNMNNHRKIIKLKTYPILFTII
jgi:hypothetical protein